MAWPELLKRETTQFADNPANAATMKLANDAIAAGDKAATAINSYGADWAKVAAAPVAALMAVSSSDLDGPFDTMKEVKAAQAALLEATKAAPAGSILSAAFGGGLTPDALKSVRAMAKDREALTRLIAEATGAVKQRSPGRTGGVQVHHPLDRQGDGGSGQGRRHPRHRRHAGQRRREGRTREDRSGDGLRPSGAPRGAPARLPERVAPLDAERASEPRLTAVRAVRPTETACASLRVKIRAATTQRYRPPAGRGGSDFR